MTADLQLITIRETTIMNNSTSKSTTISIAQSILDSIWPYATGRRGLLLLAVLVAIVGITLNWGWLVAVGAAPLLIAILPCAVMCALGLCMNHRK
jgi:hypothetical protein